LNSSSIFRSTERQELTTASFIIRTATGGLRVVQNAIDNARSTTYTRFDSYGLHGTIERAGTALHTIVAIYNVGFAPSQPKNFVGTNFNAHATPITLFLRKFQGNNR
jgi:hypothetical protein